MRLERRDDGKGELSIRPNASHVLPAAKLCLLAIWIEELFPNELEAARSEPEPSPTVRTDEPGEEGT